MMTKDTDDFDRILNGKREAALRGSRPSAVIKSYELWVN
jgi:hypothetical protein